MAKATKKEVKQDEVEVFGADKVVETKEPEKAPVVAVDEFPKQGAVQLSEWKIPMFYVIQVGGNARVYGKRGELVSGVISLSEASRIASRFNVMDPEQQAAKARGRK